MYYTLINKNTNHNYVLNDNNLNQISSYILEIKKSKFIGYIFNISDEKEASYYINLIKTKYSDAKHIVYLYSFIQEQNNNQNVYIKYDEDREPSSTFYKLILNHIQKENITNICIVIVRYFGGILLGAPLLSRTYYNTFKQAIEPLNKQVIIFYKIISLKLEYREYENLKKEFIFENLPEPDIQKKEYNDKINITYNIDEKLYDKYISVINKFKYEYIIIP